MRLALTGSSSTGKTTLVNHLLSHPLLLQAGVGYCSTDARQLLRDLGHRNTDEMSQVELRQFQLLYFLRKCADEDAHSSFITDRSFVDAAAYWLERDAFDLPVSIQSLLTDRHRQLSYRYNLHIYLPFGVVPFQPDGYRSERMDLHQRIDSRIRRLLHEWDLNFIELAEPDLATRVALVISRIEELL